MKLRYVLAFGLCTMYTGSSYLWTTAQHESQRLVWTNSLKGIHHFWHLYSYFVVIANVSINISEFVVYNHTSDGPRVSGARGHRSPWRPLPSHHLSSFPIPSSPIRSRALDLGPLNSAGGFGERCKLPQWDQRRSPNCQRFWCILRT